MSLTSRISSLVRRVAGGLSGQRYKAAETSYLTGGWLPVVRDVNDLVGRAAPIIRGRVQQLVRDFPVFTRAVGAICQYSVGTGCGFQSTVTDADGKPDRRTRQMIEDAWKGFLDECDLAGSPAFRQHGHELAALAKRQDVEGGQFIAIKSRAPSRAVPLAIGLIEPDRLSDLSAKPLPGNALWHGVEYDPATGAILALHILEGGDVLGVRGMGKSVRVEASDVFLGFDRLRPGQLHGVSPFAPAVLLARDLAVSIDAEVNAAKLASKWLAFVHAPDLQAFQAARGVAPGQVNTGKTTPSGRPVEALEDAIIEYLRPGEDVTLSSPHQRGAESFQTFARFILRLVSMTVGLPYEMLAADYQGLNYTTLRVGRNDFLQQFAPTQRRVIQQFYSPLFNAFLDSAVLAGRLDLPAYWSSPWRYRQGLFIPPGMRPIDPLREHKAAVEAIKAGLRSPQEVILERGGDPEQVLDDLAAWKEMGAERGLDFTSALSGLSTADANNPAAIAPDESDRAASGQKRLN